MTDWIARTYIVLPDGDSYRVKLFKHVVGIERQRRTKGDNVLYDRAEVGAVLNGKVFNNQALVILIEHYKRELTDYGIPKLTVTSQSDQ